MPKMPSRWRFEKIRQCWRDRSLLEQMLTVVTLFLIFLNVILLFQKKNSSVVEASPKYCTSPLCLRDASKILLHANLSTNPCDDFYEFTCGNFLKNANGEDKLHLFDITNQQLLEMYQEPILTSEHRMVRVVKKLFQTCTDDQEIERTGVETIKHVLQLAGGWPALVGSSWNPAEFDWVNSTYKLRQLGYYYNVFLNLEIVTDPDDEDRHIYQVSLPPKFKYSYGILDLESIGVMTEIATMLGAEDKQKVSAEMAEVHEFALMLETVYTNDIQHGPGFNRSYLKFTVDEYQQQCGIINWLEFINTVAGPKAKISKEDFVLFSALNNVTGWLDLISRTSKRIQANFMMWYVMEQAIPYLTRKIRNNWKNFWTPPTRADFCMEIIERRFIPNPVEIMLNRKYISMEKRKQIKEFTLNIKQELTKTANRIDWMKQDEKYKTVERIKGLAIVIVQPGNYFNDTIFNGLDVDMMELENSNNFLNLLAQANRNHQTKLYSLITESKSENFMIQWQSTVRYSVSQPSYYKAPNILFVPRAATGGLFFDEKRPRYLNYGALGSLVAYELGNIVTDLVKERPKTNLWSNATKEIFRNKMACLKSQFDDNVGNIDQLTNLELTRRSIGEQISYGAYQTWLEKNGQELKLIGINYTPNQVFWISAVSTFCPRTIPYTQFQYLPPHGADMVALSLSYNKDFVKDFNCPENPKINSSIKCEIL